MIVGAMPIRPDRPPITTGNPRSAGVRSHVVNRARLQGSEAGSRG